MKYQFFQRRYILKFWTDGAVLSNRHNAVQGTIKLIDVDKEGKPLPTSQLPDYLQTEICIYFFLGTETYENQKIFGSNIFNELQTIQENGVRIKGVKHKIDVVSCSDWKAAACIEGKIITLVNKYSCL